MPTASQHQNKAAWNESFLAAIVIDDAPEWAATAAFYAALHHVERLRSRAGDGHSSSHSSRLAYVRARLPAVFGAFQSLYDASSLARYESSAKFFAHYSADSVRDILIGRDLRQVRDFVEAACAAPPAP